MPTNTTPPQSEDGLDNILAAHRSETWSTGWNNEATEKAKQAILLWHSQAQQSLLERLLEQKQHMDDFVSISTEAIPATLLEQELQALKSNTGKVEG